MRQVKNSSNRGYVPWTGHLLWPGKTSNGGIGTPTQAHNLWPIVLPIRCADIGWHKNCWSGQPVICLVWAPYQNSESTVGAPWRTTIQRIDSPESSIAWSTGGREWTYLWFWDLKVHHYSETLLPTRPKLLQKSHTS